GHAEFGDVEQQAPRSADACRNVVAAVQAGVVDEALPAHGRARFLEVDAHHDQELLGIPAFELEQASRVVDGGVRIVNRTGADDHQRPSVITVQDRLDLLPCAKHDV